MPHTTGFQAGHGDTVVELWLRSVPSDPITRERFRNLVLLDANFDPDGLRLAWQSDQLVGAAYAVRRRIPQAGDDLEPERGWITFFFVAPEARRQGIGRQLLTEALAWLRSHGRREASFAAYAPNYILPGLDRDAFPAAGTLLESCGFRTQHKAAAMAANLVGQQIPARVQQRAAELRAAGHSFGAPAYDELPGLTRLAGEQFNPDWARAIRQAAVAGLPLEQIVIARGPDGTPAGWSMFGAYEGVRERFGPFGVAPEHRGAGLGEVLLHLALARMRARGAHTAWFLWTGEQTPAGHLYRKTGFATTRRFDVMRASLA